MHLRMCRYTVVSFCMPEHKYLYTHSYNLTAGTQEVIYFADGAYTMAREILLFEIFPVIQYQSKMCVITKTFGQHFSIVYTLICWFIFYLLVF